MRSGHEVTSIEVAGNGFDIATGVGSLRASAVVLATPPARRRSARWIWHDIEGGCWSSSDRSSARHCHGTRSRDSARPRSARAEPTSPYTVRQRALSSKDPPSWLAPATSSTARSTTDQRPPISCAHSDDWQALVTRDVVDERYLHRLTVAGGQPLAKFGGLEGRPAIDAPGTDGLFVAGDWVGVARGCSQMPRSHPVAKLGSLRAGAWQLAVLPKPMLSKPMLPEPVPPEEQFDAERHRLLMVAYRIVGVWG